MLVQVAAGDSFARLSQISTGFRMTATTFCHHCDSFNDDALDYDDSLKTGTTEALREQKRYLIINKKNTNDNLNRLHCWIYLAKGNIKKNK